MGRQRHHHFEAKRDSSASAADTSLKHHAGFLQRLFLKQEWALDGEEKSLVLPRAINADQRRALHDLVDVVRGEEPGHLCITEREDTTHITLGSSVWEKAYALVGSTITARGRKSKNPASEEVTLERFRRSLIKELDNGVACDTNGDFSSVTSGLPQNHVGVIVDARIPPENMERFSTYMAVFGFQVVARPYTEDSTQIIIPRDQYESFRKTVHAMNDVATQPDRPLS